MGSKKQQRRGWDYSKLTEGETFLALLKLTAIWGNLTFRHSCLPLPKKDLFPSVSSRRENIRGHLSEKIFLICFSPLSPQAE